MGDSVCIHEANSQYFRDRFVNLRNFFVRLGLFVNLDAFFCPYRLVDATIVLILRRKYESCKKWYGRDFEDRDRFCKTYFDEHNEAATNFFIKRMLFNKMTRLLEMRLKEK